MKDHNEIPVGKTNEGHAQNVLTGLVIGGLAGAGAMLLLAPKSGKELRSEIATRTVELRGRAVETAEETLALAQSKTREITQEVRELKHQGEHLLASQLQRVAAAAAAGSEAIEKS